jgi:hypothetical protein
VAKSFKEDNRPALQFYPNDWLREPSLRLCSLAAKGLWFDMLCLMWFGQPRGTLTVNGKPLDNKSLAKLEGTDSKKIDELLAELELYDVYSKFDNGTIYNRRMYREWHNRRHISEVRTEAGKKGAQRRWQNHSKNKAKITASTSASSSISTSASSSNNKYVDNNKKIENKKSNLRSGGPRPISDFIPGALEKLPPEAENLPPKIKEILIRGIKRNKRPEGRANKLQKDVENKKNEKEE